MIMSSASCMMWSGPRGTQRWVDTDSALFADSVRISHTARSASHSERRCVGTGPVAMNPWRENGAVKMKAVCSVMYQVSQRTVTFDETRNCRHIENEPTTVRVTPFVHTLCMANIQLTGPKNEVMSTVDSFIGNLPEFLGALLTNDRCIVAIAEFPSVSTSRETNLTTDS